MEPPVYRVGVVVDARRASIAAEAGVVVRGSDAATGAPVETGAQRATFLPVAPATVASRFRVQVGSLGDEGAARDLAARAGVAAALPFEVRFNADTRTHQARLGPVEGRGEAERTVERLGAAGFPGAWVVEEGTAVKAGALRLLETGHVLASATVFPVQGAGILEVDGDPYRGLFEVRPGESGLTVVNVVNLEDYLRGVVPNELSPSSFPEIEALEAQAVAARTYALRNRGQYQARGYDLCATPTCQVYKGRSSEHPLTDQAVAGTRGEAAFHGGALIDALYTSTCGGHTEDSANVFAGKRVPYLRGVACVPERSAWTTIRSRAPRPGPEGGLGAEVTLLAALGVVEPSVSKKGNASPEELRSWVSRLALALHRKACEGAPEAGLARRGAFFRHLVGSLCWTDRQRLVRPADVEYLLHTDDRGPGEDEGERLAAALLVHEGALSPLPDNTLRLGAPLTRAQALDLLFQVALRSSPPGLLEATFRGAEGGRVQLEREGRTENLPLDPSVRLFRDLDGHRLSTAELTLASGDTVRCVTRGETVVLLEAVQSTSGSSADRGSRYFRWNVALTPAQVAESIARYGSVGEVLDVVPRRHGVSGRVVELAVLGTEGQLLLEGLKIRWALGLRENLFVVDRQTDARGRVERFLFAGRGWGHGVGLCQVGAYGLARSGLDHEAILRHYYPGVEIRMAY